MLTNIVSGLELQITAEESKEPRMTSSKFSVNTKWSGDYAKEG